MSERNAYTRKGFSLFEMIIVMGLLAVMTGLATTLLVRSQARLRRATAAADERSQIARAGERSGRDIRAAGGASGVAADRRGDGVSLVLAMPDGARIEWLLRKDKLVRACLSADMAAGNVAGASGGDDERVYRAAVRHLRVNVEAPGAPSPFVAIAVALETVRPQISGAEGALRDVGARPRVAAGGDL